MLAAITLLGFVALGCSQTETASDPVDVFRGCMRQLVNDHLASDDGSSAFSGLVDGRILACLQDNLPTTSDVVRAEDCFDRYRHDESLLLDCLDSQLVGLPYEPPAPPEPLTPERCRTIPTCRSAYLACLSRILLPWEVGPTREDQELCAEWGTWELDDELEEQRQKAAQQDIEDNRRYRD